MKKNKKNKISSNLIVGRRCNYNYLRERERDLERKAKVYEGLRETIT